MKEAGYPGLCPERTSSASRSVGFFSGLQDWGSELTVAMAEGETHV